MGSVRKRGGIYFIRYYRSGKQHEESSGSARRGDAVRLLQLRQGDLAKGMPIAPRIGKLIGDEAFGDVLNDYRVNNKATLGLAYSRIQQHLRPFFGGRPAPRFPFFLRPFPDPAGRPRRFRPAIPPAVAIT